MNLLFKISIIGLFLTLIHLAINFFFLYPIGNEVVFVFHFFYTTVLYLSCVYVLRKHKKDNEKLWGAYLIAVSIKFFGILAFIYWMKELFHISKKQALVHVFVWFFIYLFLEVKLILEEIKKATGSIRNEGE